MNIKRAKSILVKVFGTNLNQKYFPHLREIK